MVEERKSQHDSNKKKELVKHIDERNRTTGNLHRE